MRRLSWVIWMGPRCNHIYLIRREQRFYMHRGEGGVKTDRHRDWNDAALSQGMLTATRNWKKQRAGSPPETGGSATLLTPWSQHARICAKSLDHDPMDWQTLGKTSHWLHTRHHLSGLIAVWAPSIYSLATSPPFLCPDLTRVILLKHTVKYINNNK